MKAAAFIIVLASTAHFALAQEPPPLKPWDKEPSDFRGVPFGASMSQAKSLINDLKCFAANTCHSVFRLGDRVTITTFWRFENDRFAWVGWSFPSDDFDFVRDVLIERYGAATMREEEPVQTRVGASYTNETLRWFGKQVYVSANRYGSKVTESFIQIATKEWMDREQKQVEDAKKKGATSF